MPLSFAPAEALRVGAIVLAVARDDDGDVAASMGVLSAVGGAWRTWHGGEIDRFVRPDLSLYPRFSGSPLVDVTGAVLGMNTGGLSRRQDLAVPAGTIERVDRDAAQRRRPDSARLPRRGAAGARAGPRGRPARGDRAGRRDRQSGRPRRPDRGRHPAGARRHAIADADDVHVRLGPGSVGTTIALDVLRGGTPRRLEIAVGARPDDDEPDEHEHGGRERHGRRHHRHGGWGR